MRTVTETKHAEDKIKGLGLRYWEKYKKQKAYFIINPSHRSLDFCFFDKKTRIGSFKITNKYRVMIIKQVDDSFVVTNAGDFH